jgi:hypothetical protein
MNLYGHLHMATFPTLRAGDKLNLFGRNFSDFHSEACFGIDLERFVELNFPRERDALFNLWASQLVPATWLRGEITGDPFAPWHDLAWMEQY